MCHIFSKKQVMITQGISKVRINLQIVLAYGVVGGKIPICQSQLETEIKINGFRMFYFTIVQD